MPAAAPHTEATRGASVRARLRHRLSRPAGLSAERVLAGQPWRGLGLALVVATSLVFNTMRLSQNGYANIFYSAGVKSMLRSWHNFVFVSFDPEGLITIDKPPLALWLQTLSAKLFGFSPLSLLMPEAILGALTVAAIYLLLARRLGTLAGIAGGLALAVYPIFVAVSRDNGVDPLLILLLTLACAASVRAAESGRWRTLMMSAVLIGLAFNTKTLAAYLAVPGLALCHLVCAPGSIRRRLLQLIAAGVVMAVVSFAWILWVDSVPAHERPYVGSSTNNSEVGLAFEYNGVGRVEGQYGGPGATHVKPGAFVPAAQLKRNKQPPVAYEGPLHVPRDALPAKDGGDSGREKNPIPFGPSPKPLRLFGHGLGDQIAWLLPLAALGLLALLALVLVERPPALRMTPAPPPWRLRRREQEPRAESEAGQPHPEAAPSEPVARGIGVDVGATAAAIEKPAPAPEPLLALRRDPRLAVAIAIGGWFLVEAVVLSLSKGIVHPYYVSGLAPSTAALAGAGTVAFVRLARSRRRFWVLPFAVAAVVATVATELVLMHREHYMVWFKPVLAIGCGVALLAFVALRRLSWPGLAASFLMLLVVPTGYASTTWLAPVEGTFAAAGPTQAAGWGGVGINEIDLRINEAVQHYVRSHHPGTRFEILTVSSVTASPYILLGMKAAAMGGYGGVDPALNGPKLGRMVSRGEARFVLLGGSYSLRGGNAASKAVLESCEQLSTTQWHSPVDYPFGLVLFDCHGRGAELARDRDTAAGQSGHKDL